MKSVTIIISHYESLPFLRTTLRQIEKYKNPDVRQDVIIADQSKVETFLEIVKEFNDNKSIRIITLKPLYSGFGLDYICRYIPIDTDYICQIHTDAFPISDKWLLAPITLMEENDLAFTGVLQFICDQPSPIYPYKGNGIFGMAQCWSMGKTEVYKEMSLEGGFTRFHNRPQSGLTFNSTEWSDWAKEDYNNRGSDDDVPAFFWEDNNRQHNKLSFGYTGRMGKEDEESNYGMIIEDLVFHFGFHLESRGVMPQMGSKYREWTRRINDNYSDELIAEMIQEARKQHYNAADWRLFWDGKLKKASLTSHTINQRINELKK